MVHQVRFNPYHQVGVNAFLMSRSVRQKVARLINSINQLNPRITQLFVGLNRVDIDGRVNHQTVHQRVFRPPH